MKVLVPAPIYDDLIVQPLPDAPIEFVRYNEDDTSPTQTDADAVFRWIAGKRYEALMLQSPNARWLHTASAGVDHVLTPALRERGNFILTDSGPAFGIVIGEYVLTWMLALSHRVPQLLAHQSRGEWNQKLPHEELYGQTVGIIGLGPIGLGVAQRCKAFGMTVLGHRRSERPAEHVDEIFTGHDGLTELLGRSDWVIVAAALTHETTALIGSAEISKLKPTARLINIARGALIAEEALIDALRAQRIAGAVLDVFTREPLPPESPLWSLPNTYITPHNAPGWTAGLRQRQIALFIANLHRFVHGEPLEGIVDLTRGY